MCYALVKAGSKGKITTSYNDVTFKNIYFLKTSFSFHNRISKNTQMTTLYTNLSLYTFFYHDLVY